MSIGLVKYVTRERVPMTFKKGRRTTTFERRLVAVITDPKRDLVFSEVKPCRRA